MKGHINICRVNNMRKPKKNVGKALYSINKAAKYYRDKNRAFRDNIKECLFNASFYFTDEEKKLLKDTYGVDVDQLELITEEYGTINHKSFLNNCRKDLIEFYRASGMFTTLYELDYDFDVILEDYIDYDCSFDHEELLNKGKVFLADNEEKYELLKLEIMDIEGFASEIIDKINEAFAGIETLHKILHEETIYKKIMNNLYSLKNAVIDNSELEVVDYHQVRHALNFSLAMYVIDGFSFHRIVPNEFIDPELINDDKIIDEISADNKLSEDEKITVEEAIKILSDYLNIENINDKIYAVDSIDDILSGAGLITKYKDFICKYYCEDENDCGYDYGYDYEDYED